MTEAANNDDDYEEEDYGPSLAYPPLYVLRTADYCPECEQALRVYMLGCASFHDAEDLRPIDDFHFLRLIRSVPDSVITLLKRNCPGYYLDQEEEGDDRPYLMNHCRCGAKLDDDYLQGDVGAAFWPDTPEGFAAFRLFRLPIAEPIAIECAYTIGGGEYLSIDKAEAW